MVAVVEQLGDPEVEISTCVRHDLQRVVDLGSKELNGKDRYELQVTAAEDASVRTADSDTQETLNIEQTGRSIVKSCSFPLLLQDHGFLLRSRCLGNLIWVGSFPGRLIL